MQEIERTTSRNWRKNIHTCQCWKILPSTWKTWKSSWAKIATTCIEQLTIESVETPSPGQCKRNWDGCSVDPCLNKKLRSSPMKVWFLQMWIHWWIRWKLGRAWKCILPTAAYPKCTENSPDIFVVERKWQEVSTKPLLLEIKQVWQDEMHLAVSDHMIVEQDKNMGFSIIEEKNEHESFAIKSNLRTLEDYTVMLDLVKQNMDVASATACERKAINSKASNKSRCHHSNTWRGEKMFSNGHKNWIRKRVSCRTSWIFKRKSDVSKTLQWFIETQITVWREHKWSNKSRKDVIL